MKRLTNNLFFKTSMWATFSFCLVKVMIIMLAVVILAGCSKTVYCSLDKLANACINRVTDSISKENYGAIKPKPNEKKSR